MTSVGHHVKVSGRGHRTRSAEEVKKPKLQPSPAVPSEVVTPTLSNPTFNHNFDDYLFLLTWTGISVLLTFSSNEENNLDEIKV